jgi:hypothetical protein
MLFVLCNPQFIPGPAAASERSVEPSNLLVFWTRGDKEVFLKTVYILTYYSREGGCWKGVQFLIWGPSARLLAEDTVAFEPIADASPNRVSVDIPEHVQQIRVVIEEDGFVSAGEQRDGKG